MPRKELDQSMKPEEEHIHYFDKGFSLNLCCKQATYLTLKKEELKKLSFKEESALKFHLFICRFCRAFKKQSEAINQMIKKSTPGTDFALGEDYKANLKLLINNNLNKL
jgi:hypothetical protein